MSRKVSSRCLAATLAINVVIGIFVGTVQAAPGSKGDGWPVTGKALHTPLQLSRLREVMNVHQRHAKRLLEITDVIASGTSLQPNGEPCIKVFITRPDTRGIPDFLEGVRVLKEVSARFYALRGETCDTSGDQVCAINERWPLPVPIGISVGHPDVTAGTVGARATDGMNVLLLSNNHVLADTNQANLGDVILQPGSSHGGINPEDAIATLKDFEPIDLCTQAGSRLICNENRIDAAIALSTPSELGVATPTGGFGSVAGYGAPRSSLHPAYGIPDSSGDEDLVQLLGIAVQKYGSGSGPTAGVVDTINASGLICYDPACEDIALFTDQLIISPGTFSAPGDSGSLVVDSLLQPVGLLFAGSSAFTIINRIDLVLNRFGVEVDAGNPPPTAGSLFKQIQILCPVTGGLVVPAGGRTEIDDLMLSVEQDQVVTVRFNPPDQTIVKLSMKANESVVINFAGTVESLEEQALRVDCNGAGNLFITVVGNSNSSL